MTTAEHTKEKAVGIVVRFPPQLHKATRQYCFDQEISINAYVLELIRRDLEERGVLRSPAA